MIPKPALVLDGSFELSAWRVEDAPADRRLALDPAAARFFGWTVEEARCASDAHYVEGIRRGDAEWEAGTRYRLAIRRRASGDAVGAVELRPCRELGHVSYVVAPELRGLGLAPRALEAILAWGARELGLREARIGCRVDNVASRRVAEKCGFELIGREGDELRFRRDLCATA